MVMEGEAGVKENNGQGVGAAKGAEAKGLVVDRADDRKPSQQCRHHLWPRPAAP